MRAGPASGGPARDDPAIRGGVRDSGEVVAVGSGVTSRAPA